MLSVVFTAATCFKSRGSTSDQKLLKTLILMDPCIVDYSVEMPTRCSFVIEFYYSKVFQMLNVFRAAHTNVLSL